ncbi:uncharacterized protein STEHIDRAFT_171383 [Stereum hirsutum FP-91666 SS1]|uniref:uncharacterized protein n=1 Tax=Stereum hirsutum (strain FP-91666) TaxID=721885 RepID=UPI0004449FF1|nr:uncharacterized protein STEHIDRAFT_171383 [Stereum hirsutum FP-91666 SS1]EIM82479.1 hypothetical protein STEHIDRAFT_171383 [Stereum hirsutum FP-91666 SS1]
MSDSASNVFEYETAQLSNYVWAAATSLFIYEYMLTFLTMEIPSVWCKRWNLMSALFVVNRYCFFFGCIGQTVMFLVPGRSESFCHDFFYAPIMTQFIAGITTYCLFALRVIVLYDKALWVAVVLGGLILAHQAQVIWTIALTIGIAVTDVEDTGMPDPNISLCVFTTRTDASLTPFSRCKPPNGGVSIEHCTDYQLIPCSGNIYRIDDLGLRHRPLCPHRRKDIRTRPSHAADGSDEHFSTLATRWHHLFLSVSVDGHCSNNHPALFYVQRQSIHGPFLRFFPPPYALLQRHTQHARQQTLPQSQNIRLQRYRCQQTQDSGDEPTGVRWRSAWEDLGQYRGTLEDFG